MLQTAQFKFEGNLTSFPGIKGKKDWLLYHFTGLPSVKDAIEAIGVPHVEVAYLFIDGKPALFSQRLEDGARIIVLPKGQPVDNGAIDLLKNLPETLYHFISDVHLGKLARYLRLLGFDTEYNKEADDKLIAALAASENRIVLTRDVPLLKHKRISFGYWLRSQEPQIQLKEVITYFQLQKEIKPFSRCLICNGPIYPVEKAIVKDLIPRNTELYFTDFFQCSSCKRIYWKGSHYENMVKQIENLLN